MNKLYQYFLIATSFFLALPAKAGWQEGIGIINDPTVVTLPGAGPAAMSPVAILLLFLLWLIKIFMILAVISFVIAGVIFLVSTVNPGLRERAKDAVTYSIIAIVVAFSSIVIIATILGVLTGGLILDFLI
ncbi:MAG: hypothetical protein PF549_05010 [Patescibacteria group bacterium]|jgi:hypothetical protein|nr:hypothetical protein [Patescibacteria group bacterium]